MKDDDEICLCFHVTQRKVIQFIRIEKPKLASQLSECYGAGTGCGWCRPFLKRLLEQSQSSQSKINDNTDASPNATDYAAIRMRFQNSIEEEHADTDSDTN